MIKLGVSVDCAAVISSFLAFVVYSNTFKAGFVYDDSRAVVSNKDILPTTPWTEMLKNDFWGTPLTHSGSHKSFRPLTTLSFRINCYYSGFSPWPYHVTNVILHTATTWLFTRVSRIVFRSPNTGGNLLSTSTRSLAVLVSSLLFATHPIHTEAVAGVVGRADVGATLFALAAFLFYVSHVKYRDKYNYTLTPVVVPGQEQARPAPLPSPPQPTPSQGKGKGKNKNRNNNQNNGSSTSNSNRNGAQPAQFRKCNLYLLASVLYLFLTVLLSGAAMFTKEQGITILFICAAYDLTHSILRARHYQTPFSVWRNECTASVIALVLIFLAMFHARLAIMGGFEFPEFAKADNPTSHDPNIFVRLATFLYLPVFNMQLLIYPFLLSYDWSMESIPKITSITDPRLLLVIVFYSALGRKIYLSLIGINKYNYWWPAEGQLKQSQKNPTAKCTACGLAQANARKAALAQIEEQSANKNGFHSHSRSGRNGGHGKAQLKKMRSAEAQSTTQQLLQDHLECTAEGEGNGMVLLELAFMILPFIPATNLFFYVGFVVAERVLYMPSVGYCLLVGHGVNYLVGKAEKMASAHKLHVKKIILAAFFCTLLLFTQKTLSRNEDWADEGELYESGLEVNPPKSYGNLGNILSQQGRAAEAEAAYRQALKFRLNMADVHYNLGLLLEKQERLEEALASYRSAIHFRPLLAVAYVSMGHVLTRLGRFHDAMHLFERCVKLSDEGVKDLKAHVEAKVSSLLRYGKLLVEEDEDPAAAIVIYKQALQLMPPDYSQKQSIYNAMGEALYRNGNHTEAEEWFLMALRTKPDHIPAHLTYGKMLSRNKTRVGEAEIWFKKAKRIAPEDSSVYFHYGQFLAFEGRHAEAAEMYLSAARLAPKDYDIVVGTANALRNSGENIQSEEYYEKAVALRPKDARAHMNLGAIYHVNRKYLAAEQSYLMALLLKPNDDVTETNLKKLRQLLSRGGGSTHWCSNQKDDPYIVDQ